MKRSFCLFVGIILIIIPCKVFSQNINSGNTLIPVSLMELIKVIEETTSYKVFTNVDTSVEIPIEKDEANILERLRNAFEDTSYKVSVYGDRLFILEEAELDTGFATAFQKDTQGDGTTLRKFIVNKKEKATSENKIYYIGEPYSKENKEEVTISGLVTDFKTGEPLPHINIILRNPWRATVTDENGNFSLTLPAGLVKLEISGINIKDSRRNLMLFSNGEIDIELEEEDYLLGEVTVVSGKIDNVKQVQLGVEKLQIAQIKNIPMALGEVDILKTIQSLPGVKTVGEASTGFNVRGGATDQNLILLNDGTIYNPNHLFGFFAAFSSDMIKEAEIYKSSIPAQYGGRISSVLDITGKEASKEKLTGSAGIGLVTSKLNLEIPLIKERTSILLSGRTTYSDWILKTLPEKSGYKDGAAGFYDLGMVFSHKVNEKNNLNVYGYYSRDRFAFDKFEKYIYHNLNASAKWRTVLSDKLMASFGAGYDRYDYQNKDKENQAAAFKLSFDINQVFAKSDFIWDLNEVNTINFGFKTIYYDVNSGKYEPIGAESLVKSDKLQREKALETALYVGNQWDITSQFSIDAGIRYSIFNVIGPRTYYSYQPGLLPYLSTITDTVHVGSGVFKTYHAPEFRLSARYAFKDNFSIKAGFNSMRQYIHKLSNTAIMSPTDTWKLSDMHILPQSGWQGAAGLYYDTPNGIWEFSVEGYYKKMKDYLDYRSGAELLMNHHIETDVINTEGYAYGVEFAIKKTEGKLNGWLSYTYSRTFLRQSDKLISNTVNNGDWYPTQYDKPHDVKFVGNYKLTKRYSFSVNVDYSTGRPITIPAGQYFDNELNSMQVYYTDRNSYRIPDYFRTDISFNVEPSHKLTLLTHSSISFGVYNATGRKNVYSIYYVSEDGKVNGYKMSIFGAPIPFVTYNIRF